MLACGYAAAASYWIGDSQAEQQQQYQQCVIDHGACWLGYDEVNDFYKVSYSSSGPGSCGPGEERIPDPSGPPGYTCGVSSDPCSDKYGTISPEDELGECEAPPACFKDFDTGLTMCPIPDPETDPNPDDDVPEGCVIGDGKEICLAPEEGEGCFTSNGKLICPDNTTVCGEKNGVIQCVSQENDAGCGYYNGEFVCFAPGGEEPIPSDSPDHPKNGGNGDGNENNDPTDPRSPEEGGDENNQPSPYPNQPEDGGISELTGKKIENNTRKTASEAAKANEKLGNIEDGIEGLTEEGPDGQSENQSQIDTASADALAEMGLDGEGGYIEGIGSENVDGFADSLGNEVEALFPTEGACQEIQFWTSGPLGVVSIDCNTTSRIRDILGWVFYVLTAWMLFSIVVEPVADRRG